MSSHDRCINCNAILSETDAFCSRCGHRCGRGDENEENDGTLYYSASQERGRAKLIIFTNRGETKEIHLKAGQCLIGREVGDIVFPSDDFLSPDHACFNSTPDGLKIIDNNALNGIFIRKQEKVLGETPIDIIAGRQYFRIEPIRLTNSYLEEDDTMRFVSPIQDYRFRVVHILSGGRIGQSVCSASNHVTIGRGSCNCRIDYDRYLSPIHVEIVEEGGEVIIRDLNSKNGTFFKVKEEIKLRNNDYLYIGKEVIQVEINI